jgi:hypothetical protein
MENNIMMSEVPTNPAAAQAPTPTQEVPLEVQLVNTPITDENVALNVLVAYIGLAQKRGCFNIQESAKIWEAIQRFSQPPK